MLKLERAFWSLGVSIAAWFLLNVPTVAALVVTGDVAALGILPAVAVFAARIMSIAWLVAFLPTALFVRPTAALWRGPICALAGANLGAASVLVLAILPALSAAHSGYAHELMVMVAGAGTGALAGFMASLTRSFVG